jgi:hypothetical protein
MDMDEGFDDLGGGDGLFAEVRRWGSALLGPRLSRAARASRPPLCAPPPPCAPIHCIDTHIDP